MVTSSTPTAQSSHNRKALCCKMSVELDFFLDSNKKWMCHFDDDNYVNVPRLVKLLQDYDPREDWYLGKPSIRQPLEILARDSSKPQRKISFWFATGGAGFCISRSLALKMLPLAGEIRNPGKNLENTLGTFPPGAGNSRQDSNPPAYQGVTECFESLGHGPGCVYRVHGGAGRAKRGGRGAVEQRWQSPPPSRFTQERHDPISRKLTPPNTSGPTCDDDAPVRISHAAGKKIAHLNREDSRPAGCPRYLQGWSAEAFIFATVTTMEKEKKPGGAGDSIISFSFDKMSSSSKPRRCPLMACFVVQVFSWFVLAELLTKLAVGRRVVTSSMPLVVQPCNLHPCAQYAAKPPWVLFGCSGAEEEAPNRRTSWCSRLWLDLIIYVSPCNP
ncbi:hypothetical protein HPB50_025637 [Hyalomma asiaticum]|uniref:Uncharacterized protein n=1 Tax=Hyalomma asiaticum TaxID=266040 RepID=A0ACB7T843_HYAAI|nr:hypothetical protein HPB50_025637 [Hyalomma asiaticum]